MIGLDTSVVVRLLIGEPAEQADAARDLVGRGDAVVVSDLVVGESYFALRHHYAVPHERAIAALSSLFEGAGIGTSDAALAALRGSASTASPGFMDRLIHADYVSAGAMLHTFDRGAAALAGAVRVS